MTTRLPCKTEDCTGTILPTTAEKTGGYCRPCVRAEERRKRQDFIERNRRDVDRFSGVDDPVEIVRLIIDRPKHDPLIRYLPPPMTLPEAITRAGHAGCERLSSLTLEWLASGRDDQARDLATALACLSDHDLTPIQERLVDTDDPGPGVLFRGASNDMARRLVASVEAATSLMRRGGALIALAWTRGEPAFDAFRKWQERPPTWSNDLNVPTRTYAQEAGWTLLTDGEVRQLTFEACWALVPQEEPTPFLRVMPNGSQSCEPCGRSLSPLLDLDTTAAELTTLGLSAGRLVLPYCQVCSCFGLTLFRSSADGRYSRLESDSRPEWLPDDHENWSSPPAEALGLGGRRGPLEAVEWGQDLVTHSQLGGMPSWIQRSEYPDCPECRLPMCFIGQVSMDDVEEHGDGIYYACACIECGLSSASYQQT
ncbi:MAG: hypothetical protein AAF533_03795 [Acidobacteriota bacterium]